MLSVFSTLVVISVILGTGISITLNMGIVMAAGKSIKNGAKVSPPDVIHLVMGLVNVILQCCLTVQSLLFVLCLSALFMKEVYLPLTILLLTLIYSSSWLHAWLSSFYCSIITNFTHQIFLWFRKMISMYLWLLLSLSAVGSFIIAVSSIRAIHVEIEVDSLGNFTGGRFYFAPFYVSLATILGCFLPFLLNLFAILLTFCSLIRHVKKIRQNNSGFTRQAHVSAIRRMCLMFTLCAIFCISQVMFFSSRPSTSLDSQVMISWTLVLGFPTADAIIIIQASSKIQKILQKTFCACAGKQKN